jgi:hypothetical protein
VRGSPTFGCGDARGPGVLPCMDPITLTPARVAVLHAMLRGGPADAADLAARAGLSEPLASEFLQRLQASGDCAAGPRGWDLTVKGRVMASRVYVTDTGDVASMPY